MLKKTKKIMIATALLLPAIAYANNGWVGYHGATQAEPFSPLLDNAWPSDYGFKIPAPASGGNCGAVNLTYYFDWTYAWTTYDFMDITAPAANNGQVVNGSYYGTAGVYPAYQTTNIELICVDAVFYRYDQWQEN
jgi:hypothetical protein